MTLRTDKELDEAWSNIKTDLEKGLDRTVNMIEVQKIVIGETRFKKYLYSELKKLRMKLKENFPEDDVQKMLDALRVIYIGGFLQRSGILSSEIEAMGLTNACQQLAQFNTVKEGRAYRFHTWDCTERGKKAGAELLDEFIEETKEDLYSKLKQISPKILALYILYTTAGWTRTSYPLTSAFGGPRDFFLMPLGSIIKDEPEIVEQLDRIPVILKELRLGIEMTSYVSTRGGETRGRYLVMTPEVVEVLRENLKELADGKDADEVLWKELQSFNTYTVLQRWQELVLSGLDSNEALKKSLDEQRMYWEEFKSELEPFKEKGLINISSLEDAQPIVVQIEHRDEILKELRKSVVKSLKEEDC